MLLAMKRTVQGRWGEGGEKVEDGGGRGRGGEGGGEKKAEDGGGGGERETTHLWGFGDLKVNTQDLTKKPGGGGGGVDWHWRREKRRDGSETNS